jgi:hypothetical protein
LTGTAKNVITGVVFDDQNSDAVFNAGDIGYGGAKVYLHHDINANQFYDAGTDIVDDSTITWASGRYVYVRTVAFKYVLTVDYTTLPGYASMTTDSIESAPFTGLGQFDINNNFGFDYGGDLPVSLLYFDAERAGDVVHLTWGTASEINFDHYEIERSPDGVNHEAILSVYANPGSSRSEYEATDSEPLPGASYYRLKQIDTDGSYEHSAWVRVEGKQKSTEMQVYPNPVSTGNVTINLSGSFDECGVTLLDIRGAAKRPPIVVTKSSDGGCIRVDVSTLPVGIYMAVVQVDEGFITQPLVVE